MVTAFKQDESIWERRFCTALAFASPLLAARPTAEIERTMKENAYEGTWLERTEKSEGLGAMT